MGRNVRYNNGNSASQRFQHRVGMPLKIAQIHKGTRRFHDRPDVSSKAEELHEGVKISAGDFPSYPIAERPIAAETCDRGAASARDLQCIQQNVQSLLW